MLPMRRRLPASCTRPAHLAVDCLDAGAVLPPRQQVPGQVGALRAAVGLGEAVGGGGGPLPALGGRPHLRRCGASGWVVGARVVVRRGCPHRPGGGQGTAAATSRSPQQRCVCPPHLQHILQGAPACLLGLTPLELGERGREGQWQSVGVSVLQCPACCPTAATLGAASVSMTRPPRPPATPPPRQQQQQQRQPPTPTHLELLLHSAGQLWCGLPQGRAGQRVHHLGA